MPAPNDSIKYKEWIKKLKLAAKDKKLSEIHKKHLSENHADFSGKNNPMYGKTADKNPLWKGKKYLKCNRWWTWINNKRILQARYIAEQYVGKKFIKNKEVHHINGDSLDDRPENLYIFQSKGKHIGYHNLNNKPILVSNLILR